MRVTRIFAVWLAASAAGATDEPPGAWFLNAQGTGRDFVYFSVGGSATTPPLQPGEVFLGWSWDDGGQAVESYPGPTAARYRPAWQSGKEPLLWRGHAREIGLPPLAIGPGRELLLLGTGELSTELALRWAGLLDAVEAAYRHSSPDLALDERHGVIEIGRIGGCIIRSLPVDGRHPDWAPLRLAGRARPSRSGGFYYADPGAVAASRTRTATVRRFLRFVEGADRGACAGRSRVLELIPAPRDESLGAPYFLIWKGVDLEQLEFADLEASPRAPAVRALARRPANVAEKVNLGTWPPATAAGVDLCRAPFMDTLCAADARLRRRLATSSFEPGGPAALAHLRAGCREFFRRLPAPPSPDPCSDPAAWESSIGVYQAGYRGEMTLHDDPLLVSAVGAGGEVQWLWGETGSPGGGLAFALADGTRVEIRPPRTRPPSRPFAPPPPAVAQAPPPPIAETPTTTSQTPAPPSTTIPIETPPTSSPPPSTTTPTPPPSTAQSPPPSTAQSPPPSTAQSPPTTTAQSPPTTTAPPATAAPTTTTTPPDPRPPTLPQGLDWLAAIPRPPGSLLLAIAAVCMTLALLLSLLQHRGTAREARETMSAGDASETLPADFPLHEPVATYPDLPLQETSEPAAPPEPDEPPSLQAAPGPWSLLAAQWSELDAGERDGLRRGAAAVGRLGGWTGCLLPVLDAIGRSADQLPGLDRLPAPAQQEWRRAYAVLQGFADLDVVIFERLQQTFAEPEASPPEEDPEASPPEEDPEASYLEQAGLLAADRGSLRRRLRRHLLAAEPPGRIQELVRALQYLIEAYPIEHLAPAERTAYRSAIRSRLQAAGLSTRFHRLVGELAAGLGLRYREVRYYRSRVGQPGFEFLDEAWQTMDLARQVGDEVGAEEGIVVRLSELFLFEEDGNRWSGRAWVDQG